MSIVTLQQLCHIVAQGAAEQNESSEGVRYTGGGKVYCIALAFEYNYSLHQITAACAYGRSHSLYKEM